MTTAVDRAQELMRMPLRDVPELALDYAKKLSATFGGCSEVMLTAYATYAQIVENYHTDDPLYKVTDLGHAAAWFAENMPANNPQIKTE